VNFNDRWSQVLNMLYDQDGSVYIIDWYDKNQCHHGNESGHDRSNGRIFKLVYNEQKFTLIDLQKRSSAELVRLLSHKNQFYARHARRILQERGPEPAVHQALLSILSGPDDELRQLNALWALHVTGGLSESEGLKLLKSAHEYVRAWAIQLMCEERGPSDTALAEFEKLAANDPSPVVRLYLASVMQRTAPEKRWAVIVSLLKRDEDAQDHNLPLMYWYATEGAIAADPARGIKLLSESKIPKVRQFIARRITSTSKAVAAK
jgi:HEAT repeat protein